MTRYVLSDLEEVGAELGRRAAEVARWLDEVADAGVSGAPGAAADDAALAEAVAQVDLVCYQALSAVASRLASAAESVAACAGDMRGMDAELAERMCRGVG